MPYSEYQIDRHIKIMDEKAIEEADGNEEDLELTKLYQVVDNQEEADAYNFGKKGDYGEIMQPSV